MGAAGKLRRRPKNALDLGLAVAVMDAADVEITGLQGRNGQRIQRIEEDAVIIRRYMGRFFFAVFILFAVFIGFIRFAGFVIGLGRDGLDALSASFWADGTVPAFPPASTAAAAAVPVRAFSGFSAGAAPVAGPQARQAAKTSAAWLYIS